MNANLFRKEIKRNRVRFLLWAVMIAAFIIFTIALIPTMAMEVKLQVFLDALPQGITAAFGIDAANFTNPLGIYVIYHVFYALLFGGIFAVSLGMEIIAKEEGRRTAEFLLTRPLTRDEVVAAKVVAALVYVFALNIVMALMSWGSLRLFISQPIDQAAFWVLSSYSLLLNLAFAALGFFLSLLVRRGRVTMALGVAVVLGAYFLDVFSKASTQAAPFGWLSPFHYVDSEVLRPGYGLEWWRVLILVGVTAVFILVTFLRYRRKDILI
jgi:ABC-2 type transport system permease protein